MNGTEQVRQHRLIRDTTGLTGNEKGFCRLIVDRGGVLYATWKQNAADMGVGKDAYYRARDGVLAKGVVHERRGYKTTTSYTLNLDLLGGDLSRSRHSGNPEPKTSCISTPTSDVGEQVPSLPSVATEPKATGKQATEAESAVVTMCEFHLSYPADSCPYCSAYKVKSHLPEWKQRQLYERGMADEGLNQHGAPLGMDY